jgi:hypothetical protein
MEIPNQQLYYAENLPSLTNLQHNEENQYEIQKVMENMAFSWIKNFQ